MTPGPSHEEVMIGARVPRTLRDAVREQARLEDRTLSAEVRLALAARIEARHKDRRPHEGGADGYEKAATTATTTTAERQSHEEG